MDGKGTNADNILVERVWRTVKYEEVYLKAHCIRREAKHGLVASFHCYHTPRLQQDLGCWTPAVVSSDSGSKQ